MLLSTPKIDALFCANRDNILPDKSSKRAMGKHFLKKAKGM
jgi:hypothetical protein